MEKLYLDRLRTSITGTFGQLIRAGHMIAVTCELPWNGNKEDISCIPNGVYFVTRYHSPSKGEVFLLNNVPDRSMVEIHIGNTIKDIEGCIAVGSDFGKVNDDPGIINSAITFHKLLNDLPTAFYIQIMGVCG